MKDFNVKLNFNDVLTAGNNIEILNELKIISNITLEPVLSKFIHYYDHTLKICNSGVEEFLSSNEKADIECLFFDIKLGFPFLYFHLYELDQKQIAAETEKLINYLSHLINKMIESSKYLILITFSRDCEDLMPVNQIKYNAIADRMNNWIQEFSIDYENILLLDMNEIILKIGTSAFYNLPNYYLVNMPYSSTACNHIAYKLAEKVYQLSHSCKKCIILDCDNVLWGGNIGDDGIKGIQLSGNFIGRAYLEFQREIIKLFYQGIILCICSKNSYEDVMEVINNHPDMLLRDDFITAKKINYCNKADNIRQLSEELNISMESMVFLDDSPYEIELVKREIPEVITIQLEKSKPYTFAKKLRECRYFWKNRILNTDSNRGKWYQDNDKRKEAIQKFTDINQYHKYLKTEISIKLLDEINIYRVAELSKRSNQFNLSADHFSVHDLSEMMACDNYEILYLCAHDILGDMGIVAASVTKYYDSCTVINAFFLSCRVFGRGFETELLKEIRQRSYKKGIEKIYGIYRENSKNYKFRTFYQEQDIEYRTN